MGSDLYSIAMQVAALTALTMISFLLGRASPRSWLNDWNVAWLLYVLHVPLNYLAEASENHALLLKTLSLLLAIAAQAGLATAAARLANQEKWRNRLWIVTGILGLGTAVAALGSLSAMRAVGLTVLTFMVLAAVPFAWIHAQSRRTAGGWLLLVAYPLQLAYFAAPASLPSHTFQAFVALIALVSGLLVCLEELRDERLWRLAALRFTTAMAAGGGAADVETLCAEIAEISGAYAVHLLENNPHEEEKRRSAILSSRGFASSRSRQEALAAKGRINTPLSAGGQDLGSLVLVYNRSLPGPPVRSDLLQQVADQIALTLRGSQLTKHLNRAHSEWLHMVDSIHDFVLVHTAEGRIERINRRLVETTGRGSDELVGRLCREVLPGAGENWRDCPFCEDKGNGEEFNPDFGGYFLISTSRTEEPGSVLHVVRDVSARKAAEDRYRYIFENVREGVFVSTPEGYLVDCNEGLARMLGYTREELLHIHIPSALWVDASQRGNQMNILDSQGYVEDYEIHLRKKSGEEMVGLETSFASRSSTGKVVRYQGFIVDVTERHRAEGELRRQNELLSRVNDLTGRMTHRLDRQEALTATVQEICLLFGFDTAAIYIIDESTGMSVRTAAAGFRTQMGLTLGQFRATPSVIQALRRGVTKPVFASAELGALAPEVLEVQKAEGLKSIFAMPLTGEHLLGVISLSSRTERTLSLAEENLLGAIGRQLNNTASNILLFERVQKAYQDLQLAQEQLLQSQKLAAVGQLVSGVAHELNNPLAAIIGYSQLLATHVTPKGSEYLDKLLRQAKRTQKIIQDLLTFSRQRKPERTRLDLNTVVEGALLLREFDIRSHHVEVVRHLSPNLPHIEGDRHQLEQAFLNIIQNACDAILEAGPNGTLEVRTYLANDAGRSHLVLEFLDDGIGMKEPNRVFEPFYTTKKVGMGTGLGLSICYGILKEHGGEISAESRVPRGAIFRVRLPSLDHAVAQSG